MDKNNHPVVAIVGMCGSGKSELTKLFTELKWQYVHFGNVTMMELKKRGLDKNEQNERIIREELRAEHGLGAFAKILLPTILAYAGETPTVLDGVYSWSEYKILKEELKSRLVVLAIATNRPIRYSRLKNRPIRPLTEQEATQRDIAEIENLEKGGPIAIADYYMVNNGTPEELRQQFDAFMAWLSC